MTLLPRSLQDLVSELGKLPGAGEKTALRYAVSLLKGDASHMRGLQRAMTEAHQALGTCPTCYFWTENDDCSLCMSRDRIEPVLCVVRDAADVLSLEKFRSHPWRYHVLGGLLSPLRGVGPRDLHFQSLLSRLEGIQEVILALDSTVEGDATAFFLKDYIAERFPQIRLTRASQGLPAGASVEYLDPGTLESSLVHRVQF